MNVEPSRKPEGNWHVWYIPRGLSRSNAIETFLQMKPKVYTFDTFRYDEKTGRVMTA